MGVPTIYSAGETVICPGAKVDRRTTDRGDRRAEPRPTVPCRHRWGRVAAESCVRVTVRDQGAATEPTMILECPDCRMAIDLVVLSDPGQAEVRQTRREAA